MLCLVKMLFGYCFVWLKWWFRHFTSSSSRDKLPQLRTSLHMLWAELLVLQVLQFLKSWDKYSFLVAFLILEITEAAAVLFFCLCVKTPAVYLHAGWSMPCGIPVGILPRCEKRWFVLQLSPASLTTRALSFHPIPWSRMWLRPNHQGWFCSLEFPHGCHVHLLSIAAEKHWIQQLLLLKADLKCWTLLLWTQLHVIAMIYHDLVEHQAHLSSQSIWKRLLQMCCDFWGCAVQCRTLWSHGSLSTQEILWFYDNFLLCWLLLRGFLCLQEVKTPYVSFCILFFNF